MSVLSAHLTNQSYHFHATSPAHTQRPDWQRACKEEIDAVMGDRPLSEMTYEDLQVREMIVWRCMGR